MCVCGGGGGGGGPACEPLTASTVGMGDCQAAAKYTLGSVSGSSSALSEPRFRFSDKSALESQETVVTGERSRVGDLCVREDLTCRRLIGTIGDGRGWGGGAGVVTEVPRYPGKRTEVVRLSLAPGFVLCLLDMCVTATLQKVCQTN